MLNRFAKIAAALFVMVLLSTMSVFGQSVDDRAVDVKIYFPYDQAYIDMHYMDNEYNLHIADSLLSDLSYISTLRKIEITAQSSPEGRVEYNEQLSERRRLSLIEYFTTKYPHIDSTLWSFKAVAENWELFHEHLLEDQNIPNRERVLAISEADRKPDDKEWLLKLLDDGEPWLYIKEHILPSQRFGASMLFIPMQYLIYPKPLPLETVVTLPPLEMPRYEPRYVPPVVLHEPKLLFALKTNLVLDALSVVNLGIEIPIGDRFSVVGEVIYPWWRNWDRDFTMQIESYHAEFKFWLGDRGATEQLQGWYVGLYGGWGRYDIQPFSTEGVQGSFTDFGLEVGFAHRVARNLNLEYTLGFGYVSTCWDDYYMANDTDGYGYIKVIPYPWMQNSLSSVLPTRFGVSLVWTIKNGGRR